MTAVVQLAIGISVASNILYLKLKARNSTGHILYAVKNGFGI